MLHICKGWSSQTSHAAVNSLFSSSQSAWLWLYIIWNM